MSVSVRAGELRDVLEIQRKGEDFDTLGQPSTTWSRLAVVRGKIQSLTGTEAQEARQLTPMATVQIEILYLSTLKVGDRIQSSGKTYNVGHINDVQNRRVKHILTCSEPKSV